MRLTRRQLLASLAASIVPVGTGHTRRHHRGNVLDLRYSISGERAPMRVTMLVLACPVRMRAGEYRGDAYFSDLITGIDAQLSLPLVGTGLDQLATLRVHGDGTAASASMVLERLLAAADGMVSWELRRGAASGIYSLNLRRL